MSVYEVPLIPSAQSLSITLSGTVYSLRLIYADAVDGDGGWLLDIADQDGNALLSGLPLVTGADLLAQHASLAIPGQWYAVTDGEPSAVPSFNSLGVTSHLLISL